MGKIVIAAIVLALVLIFSISFGYIRVYAEDEISITAEERSDSDNENNALTKLSRGVCNLATFVLEVPAEMGKVNEKSGPLAAGSLGLFKGMGRACIRMLTGVYEIATFPIPYPSGYKPVLDDPEYFYTDRTW